jgi:hypothetical protein
MEAVGRDIVEVALSCHTGKRVGEVDPRRQEKSASWERNALIAKSDKHIDDHATTSRVTTKEDSGWIAMLNDMKVGSDTIV